MRIDIVAPVPELLEGFLGHSIIKRAGERELVKLRIHDLREYGIGRHQQIDDYQYGGGAGMVLMPQPVFACVEKLQSERIYDEIIFMTPDAPLFSQKKANYLSTLSNIIILCGHYKGIDQRVREHLVTCEISIGDYVLSGGELPAAVLADAVIRLLPGVLNDETSALTDSFQDELLAPPVYTRPAVYQGMKVPEVLRSGDFKRIGEWREQKALEKTRKLRPRMLKDQ